MGGFFSTLQWSDEAKERDQQAEPPELRVGLLNNDSDDEDDFGSIRAHEQTGNVPAGYEAVGGISETKNSSTVDFFSEEFKSKNVESEKEVVDLLNIDSEKSNNVVDQIDLLNIGGDPSNFDLLSGHDTRPQSRVAGSHEPDLLEISSTDDTFDPFQQFTGGPGLTPKPDLMTSVAPSSDDSFDPFQNFPSSSQAASMAPAKQASSTQKAKPATADSDFFAFMESSESSSKAAEPDLMTSWNATSIKNLNQQNTSTATNNLNPGFGGMHKSASTGSSMNFSSMLDSFGGRSSPQPGMMGKGGGLGPVPKADPFADLGKHNRWIYN